MKNKINPLQISDKKILFSFLAVETICYIIFICMDLFNYNSNDVKFLSILICLITVFYFARKTNNRIIIIPFMFTVLADVHLLILDDYYVFGTILFCIVQLCYAARIMFKYNSENDSVGNFINSLKVRESDLFNIITVVIRILIYSIVMISLYINNQINALTVFALLSYTLLFTNVLFSLISVKKIKNGFLFFIGLLLFLLCDTCVGIKNIDMFYNFPSDILKSASILIWIFYLPSQVLLALSFIINTENNNEK